MLGVGVMWGSGVWGMCTKNRRYCTMFKRYCTILRKLKNGGMAIFETKTLSMYLKKRVKKNIDRARIRTHDLRVRENLLSYPLG